MLVFVNQFTGTFLYNYAIRNGVGVDDQPHEDTSGHYKIALFKCKPGQKLTIAHNSSKSTHLVIGCSDVNLKQNIIGSFLVNVVEIDLAAGEGYQYTCTSKSDNTHRDATWLCIQCPSDYGNIEGEVEKTITLQLGDINQDGIVNMQDYHLLASYTATGPGSEELHWEATRKQLAAMDLNQDGVVDNRDTLEMEYYIQGYIPVLDAVPYTYTIPGEYTDGNNISNFLIIEGHYDKSINIPFSDFITDSWIVHGKFFN